MFSDNYRGGCTIVTVMWKLQKLKTNSEVGRTLVHGQAKISFLWLVASEDQSKVKDPDRSYKFGSGELILVDPDP